MLITFDKLKRADDFTQPSKIVPFFGITGKECDLSKSAAWQGSPRGVWGFGSGVYVRCSQLSPSQPGKQRHEPSTWSQPAAFLHLHTWWQSIPKNPSGQAGNAKHSFLAQLPSLFFFFFCINSISSFQRFLRTEVASRVKPAQL